MPLYKDMTSVILLRLDRCMTVGDGGFRFTATTFATSACCGCRMALGPLLFFPTGGANSGSQLPHGGLVFLVSVSTMGVGFGGSPAEVVTTGSTVWST